jgi:hypothetical protein
MISTPENLVFLPRLLKILETDEKRINRRKMKWTIQRVDGFSKCLRDLSAVALKNFDRKILELEKSEDPTVSAKFVPGRRWMIRLMGSYRLAFRIIPANQILQPITTGDHKKIYGKDKHS